MGKRDANYDFMRVLMSIFVICIHTPLPKNIYDNYFLYCLVISFLFQCNGVFFMISGKFNLRKTFDSKNEYVNYYIGKFISIIVPYGIASCIIVLLEVLLLKEECNMNGYIYRCIESFFSSSSRNHLHLWFMCNLIGMIVSAPFLAKMVNNMKNFELKVLFIVGIVWSIMSIYLTTNMGIEFGFKGFFIGEWSFIFFLGFFCDKVINERNIKIVYIVGIVGYITTILGQVYVEHFVNATDLSTGFIMFTMSCYLFYERHIHIKNEVISKVFSYLGKYSFLAYMFHYFIVNNITSNIFDTRNGMIEFILCVATTFVMSYAISILVSFCVIKPVQKIILFVWKKTFMNI